MTELSDDELTEYNRLGELWRQQCRDAGYEYAGCSRHPREVCSDIKKAEHD